MRLLLCDYLELPPTSVLRHITFFKFIFYLCQRVVSYDTLFFYLLLDLFLLFSYSYLTTKNEEEHPRPKFRSSSQHTKPRIAACHMTMIRKFTLLCKLNSINNSDFCIFKNAQDSFVITSEVCPTCGARHLCSYHASYERTIIVIENSAVICHNVSISRGICSSCGHTHALLPDVLIPYASFSLFFILKVLRLYFLHSYTVEKICSMYSISISTLYAWIRLFHKQKSLWLGVLSDLETSALSFLTQLLDTPSFPVKFFHAFHFSFLQQYRFTTVSHLP